MFYKYWDITVRTTSPRQMDKGKRQKDLLMDFVVLGSSKVDKKKRYSHKVFIGFIKIQHKKSKISVCCIDKATIWPLLPFPMSLISKILQCNSYIMSSKSNQGQQKKIEYITALPNTISNALFDILGNAFAFCQKLDEMINTDVCGVNIKLEL